MSELRDRQADRLTWKHLTENVDTFLLDCDGVLWTANADVIQGSVESVSYIRSLGKKICFVTNNSSKSRSQYLEKLQKLGFEANESEIFPSSYTAAYYLRHIAKYSGEKVYLVGMSGTQTELEKMGYRCIGQGIDPVQGTLDDWLQMTFDTDVNAVVVGLDYHISYMKLIRAATYLRNPDCLFIATNEDTQLPTRGHVSIPGTGSIVSAVKTAAERDPVVVGKPCPPMFQCISNSVGIDPNRAAMIGDRLETDILFGKRNGLKTVLVLSGVTTEQKLLHSTSNKELLPDYYATSIADILSCRN